MQPIFALLCVFKYSKLATHCYFHTIIKNIYIFYNVEIEKIITVIMPFMRIRLLIFF